MRDPRNGRDFYPRLVRWKDWEFPRPGGEALIGFAVACGVSAMLHAGLVALCTWLRGTE